MIPDVTPYSISSYPKVYRYGESRVADILNQDVIIQEKIAGLEISFIKDATTILHVFHKKQKINKGNPPKVFCSLIDSLEKIKWSICQGWIYRCMYLPSPNGWGWRYERAPKERLVLFDIQDRTEKFINRTRALQEASRLGVDLVPEFLNGIATWGEVKLHLQTAPSLLGGGRVYGLVIKPTSRYEDNGEQEMAKVQQAPLQRREISKPTTHCKDIIGQVASTLKHKEIWLSTFLEMKDRGDLELTRQDIQPLSEAVLERIWLTCGKEIKDTLFRWGWARLEDEIVKGLPEWYKGKLKELEPKAIIGNGEGL